MQARRPRILRREHAGSGHLRRAQLTIGARVRDLFHHPFGRQHMQGDHQPRENRFRRAAVFAVVIVLLTSAALAAPPTPRAERATPAQLQAIRDYIKQSWQTLQRSNARLAVAAPDPKFKTSAGSRWPVYVSRKENVAAVEAGLRKQMSEADFARIEILQLPEDLSRIKPQALLYLPHPYVVPGGRFNEMYGWDSYFIQVGLLRDGEIELAKDMIDNFIYEVENYGKVLNANRTYYLTRSQPPLLTQMVLGVYNKTHDRKWLEDAVPEIEKYYQV